jgi:predicted transcriptional regulator
MKSKLSTPPETILVNFRLPQPTVAKLNQVATAMRRTRKSIVDQLIEKYCAVEHLQP